ncbi:MAG TPA: VOC family protein [Thermoplasmata archaeon]|nr:VOC family protein [Thermoplasmata archaeon]
MSAPRGSGQRVQFSNPEVNLYVGNIEGSIRFYRDVLGFTETFRTPKEGPPEHLELRLGSFTLGLATFDALKRHHGIQSGPGPARLEVDFGTEDVDGAYGWGVSHGAPSVHSPYDFLGYIHAAAVADPDGNYVVFHTRLPVKTTANPAARPTFRNHLFNFYTSDIERSLEFYRGLLGFTETFRVPEEGPPEHVELELGPLNLGVSTLEALRQNHGMSGGGGPPRGEVVLWVTDVDAAHTWMQAQGTPSLSPPHDFAGVLRGAWVGDPDGNPVQMVARRGPG